MDISSRLTETLTIKRTTSHTTAGDKTRGTTTTMFARIEREVGTVDIGNGQVMEYNARIFTTAEVALDDLLFFPEDDPNTQNTGRTPVRVETDKDLWGSINFYTTYL